MDGTNFELVEDFMEAMGQDVNVVPHLFSVAGAAYCLY